LGLSKKYISLLYEPGHGGALSAKLKATWEPTQHIALQFLQIILRTLSALVYSSSIEIPESQHMNTGPPLSNKGTPVYPGR